MSNDYYEVRYRQAGDRIQWLERGMLIALLQIEQGRSADAQRTLADLLPETDLLASPAHPPEGHDDT
jgi:hypothetical protein